MDAHFSPTIATVLTFFFAVAAARTSFHPTIADVHLPVAVQSIDHNNHINRVNSLPESVEGVSNLVILPAETTRSGSNAADRVVKSENDGLIRVDLTPRSDFARFHAINRHFFDESRLPLRFVNHRPNRRFRNPFVMSRSKISPGDGNEVTLTGETGSSDAEKFHRHCSTPSTLTTRLRFKHDNGHQTHQIHHHRHQHHHIHHDNKFDVSIPKRKFSREKMKSLVHQHKEKSRQHEVSFMKSIRKFLKHTFE